MRSRRPEKENTKMFGLMLCIYFVILNLDGMRMKSAYEVEQQKVPLHMQKLTKQPLPKDAKPKPNPNRALPPFSHMPQRIGQAMEWIVRARKANGQRATFVQIGANDGKTLDRLYPQFQTTLQKQNWIGLQVEPQPQLYGALAVLHADAPDWSFYLGAVDKPEVSQQGRISFCETKTPGQGDWTTQGSITLLERTIVPVTICTSNNDLVSPI
jgi:hypothetical protein